MFWICCTPDWRTDYLSVLESALNLLLEDTFQTCFIKKRKKKKKSNIHTPRLLINLSQNRISGRLGDPLQKCSPDLKQNASTDTSKVDRLEKYWNKNAEQFMYVFVCAVLKSSYPILWIVYGICIENLVWEAEPHSTRVVHSTYQPQCLGFFP